MLTITEPARSAEVEHALHALRCAYCHDGLEGAASQPCPGCDTRLHAGCWKEAGACPTLGCVALGPSLGREPGVEVRSLESSLDSYVSGGIGSLLFAFVGACAPLLSERYESMGIALAGHPQILTSVPSTAWWTLSLLSLLALTLKDRWTLPERRHALNWGYAGLIAVAAALITLSLLEPVLFVWQGTLCY